LSRVSSAVSAPSSSIEKGGVGERERISRRSTWSSISPVGRSGFTFCGSRATTLPWTEIVNSGPSFAASACSGPRTTCVMP
jgi:hypothetical protein